MVKKKSDKQEFDEYCEEWIMLLSPAEIVSVPGVANLLTEYYNNTIIKEYEEEQNEELR